jgi:50S ribosomal protein L16 3-hydroxylase
MNCMRRRAMTEGILRRLGEEPVARFLARSWGRRPARIRNALGGPGWTPPVSRELLFALASREGVESRLATCFEGRWKLRHGPFPRRALPALSRREWTLLVQGVDLHHRPAADLAARFRFLPAARFDDVMVSYATPGGGVGPHVDQYDVFLLQAHGRRRWRIASQFDPTVNDGLPLRVLRNFRHEQEFVLEPGDLLYLPPGIAHEGVALDECITISVGFRVLPWQEIAQAWLDLQAEESPLEGRMREGRLRVTRSPARLGGDMVRSAHLALAPLRPSPAQAERALLVALTEPKPQVWFEPPRPALSAAHFARRILANGIRTDLRTRMLHAGSRMAINGELFRPPAPVRSTLARLADARRLEPARLARLGPEARSCLLSILHGWYGHGWLEPVVD